MTPDDHFPEPRGPVTIRIETVGAHQSLGDLMAKGVVPIELLLERLKAMGVAAVVLNEATEERPAYGTQRKTAEFMGVFGYRHDARNNEGAAGWRGLER